MSPLSTEELNNRTLDTLKYRLGVEELYIDFDTWKLGHQPDKITDRISKNEGLSHFFGKPENNVTVREDHWYYPIARWVVNGKPFSGKFPLSLIKREESTGAFLVSITDTFWVIDEEPTFQNLKTMVDASKTISEEHFKIDEHGRKYFDTPLVNR